MRITRETLFFIQFLTIFHILTDSAKINRRDIRLTLKTENINSWADEKDVRCKREDGPPGILATDFAQLNSARVDSDPSYAIIRIIVLLFSLKKPT